MNIFRLLSLITMAALIGSGLAECDPTPTPAQPPALAHLCWGDLFVERLDVSRITPEPALAYTLNSTTNWTAPYGVNATGSGKAVMQVYNENNQHLATFNLMAAQVAGGQMTVQKWNGSKEIVFNAGNFYVKDSGGQNECRLTLMALGVGISTVGTEYLVTVRPEEREVIVVILDGMVRVESQGREVVLDAQDEASRLVVVRDGEIQPPQPVPDPGRLLELVLEGRDIPLDRLDGQLGEPPPVREPVRTAQVLQPEPLPQKPASLTVLADRRIAPALQEAGAAFEKEQGIRLIIEAAELPEILERFSTAWHAGAAPDLLTLWHTDVFRLVEEGLLAPLEPSSDPDELVPGTRQAFLVEGVSYGAPIAYQNLALVSNTNHITDIPRTWSDVTGFARVSRSQERFFVPLLLPTPAYFFYPIQSAFGGYLFDYDPRRGYTRDETGLDKEGSLNAAGWLEQMAADQYLQPRSMDEAMAIFRQGNGAMLVTGPWSLPDLRSSGQPYQISPFPGEAQQSQPLLSVLGFGLSSSSQDLEYARLLALQYLTGRGVQRAFSRQLELPPAHLGAFEGIDADVRDFGGAGRSGVPIPPIPEMDLVWGPWDYAVEMVLVRELSGKDAFYGAAEEIWSAINR